MHRHGIPHASFKGGLPALGSCLLTATLLGAMSGCSGGNNMTSAPSAPPAPPVILSIASVSNTSPSPLTPLQINTSGLSASAPVVVEFSNNLGFSATEQPVRVSSDGTIIAGVPLYVDPTTGLTAPGTVSLVVTQGGQSSASISLNIQDLPALSTYGTQLGQISHAVLVLDAMLIGRRINQLQAFQLLPGNTVDTTQAQATLNMLLNSVVQARSDVDRVMLDNSVVVSGGTLSNGAIVQFDQNSLDMMDRVSAVFLTQTFASLDSSVSGSSARGKARVSRRRGSSSASSVILTLVKDMQTISDVSGFEASALMAQNSCTTSAFSSQCVIDSVSVLGTVAGAYSAAIINPAAPGTIAPNAGSRLLGAAGAVLSNMDVIGHVFGDLAAVILNSGDAATLTSAVTDLNNIPRVQLYSALVGLLQAPVFVEMEGLQPLLNPASTVLNFLQIKNATETQMQSTDSTTLNLANLVRVPSSDTQGIGTITGNVTTSNSQGTAAAQTGLDLCCFGSSGSGVVDVADPSGDYAVYVPLQVSGTPYSSLTLSAFDPISNQQLASETVDLSGLNTSAPVQVPSMTGTCNDADASSPDADDPDCD